jgi:uncharacterized protein (TIGR00251 family)
MPYLTLSSDATVLLRLHVQPKASKSRLIGLHDSCLKLAVAAPPVEGKANKEVVKFLAAVLGVPARDVTVKSGLQARRKVVAVKALTGIEARTRIERSLASTNEK